MSSLHIANKIKEGRNNQQLIMYNYYVKSEVEMKQTHSYKLDNWDRQW